MWFISNNERNVDVRLLRGKQVLAVSFQSGSPPQFWQFDLEKNHSFTISLQEQGTEWELGITSSDGIFRSVCQFPSRVDAEEAYESITKELIKRKVPMPSNKSSRLWPAAAILLILIITWFMISLVLFSGGNIPQINKANVTNTAKPGQPVATQPLPDGVPVNANDVLPNPSE